MRRPPKLVSGLALVGVGLAIGLWMATPERNAHAIKAVDRVFGTSAAQAQASKDDQAKETETVSPVLARPRDTYYPNTEDLKPDEMRVIACGTGMPTTRMKQAAACFLVELGNGDKFLFDAGSGSAERISALQIPYNYLDKIFIGHLHSDHFGAVPEYWIGGALMGRNQPLRIWGPSGRIPELGTAAAMDAMQKMYLWDITGRVGNVDPRGYKLEVHEFDYKGENQVVYDENGVVIRSFPAVHAIDGAVSYSLEWNGLKFVYGSDTFPNKWFNKYAKNADIAIHECFIADAKSLDRVFGLVSGDQ
jgi:ribonuclease Z